MPIPFFYLPLATSVSCDVFCPRGSVFSFTLTLNSFSLASHSHFGDDADTSAIGGKVVDLTLIIDPCWDVVISWIIHDFFHCSTWSFHINVALMPSNSAKFLPTLLCRDNCGSVPVPAPGSELTTIYSCLRLATGVSPVHRTHVFPPPFLCPPCPPEMSVASCPINRVRRPPPFWRYVYSSRFFFCPPLPHHHHWTCWKSSPTMIPSIRACGGLDGTCWCRHGADNDVDRYVLRHLETLRIAAFSQLGAYGHCQHTFRWLWMISAGAAIEQIMLLIIPLFLQVGLLHTYKCCVERPSTVYITVSVSEYAP